MEKVETLKAQPLAFVAIFVAALMATLLLSVGHSSAASLKATVIRFDRMKISQGTTGTVCAAPNTVASTEGKVVVTFPAGYTVTTTALATNWAVNTTNLAWPTISGYTTAAWPGVGTAATAAAGQDVTFASGDLISSTTLYCFNWTATTGVSVKSTASSNSGSIATQTGASAAIDSASYTTSSITDDQIAVSASVAQTFTFALSANTDNLGALSTGAVSASPTPRTVSVSTNAKNGWNVWANDSAPTGLTSTAAGYTIASSAGNTTLAAGTEGYNTGLTAVNGTGSTVTVAPTFVGGSLGKGGGLSTALQSLATSPGPNNNAVLTLTNNAAISSTTPPASDYADTITVVGAGLF
ncbi:hypothetical protein H7097_04435 [Aeromicrobium sp.]|nr:hypothetical protein [Candidatus Saccharibacteria bacterium]